MRSRSPVARGVDPTLSGASVVVQQARMHQVDSGHVLAHSFLSQSIAYQEEIRFFVSDQLPPLDNQNTIYVPVYKSVLPPPPIFPCCSPIPL
jgi:hypothetical protein